MKQVNCFSTTNELYAALRKNYVDAIAGHEAMLGSLVQEVHAPEDAPEVYTRLATEKSFPVVQFDWREQA